MPSSKRSKVRTPNRTPLLRSLPQIDELLGSEPLQSPIAEYGRDLIAGLERVKNSFNCYPIDSLASACAIAALEDREYFEATCSKIIDIRSWLTEILTQRGFRVLPSNTNFLLASHPDIPAKQLFASLKQQGVLVRYFNKPRIDNFIRITIGTREEVEQLVALLPESPAS